jgi:putative acetyltransferase
MAWTIEERAWDDPAGAALRGAQRAELDERYGCDDHEPGTPPSAVDIDLFLVAVDPDGHALGCGALRRLDRTSAEIKRMYVTPAVRGSGVATGLLRALEAAAVHRGWTTLKLETGTAQPESVRFYEREGYRSIPLFGAYRGADQSLCYARDLVERSPAPDGGGGVARDGLLARVAEDRRDRDPAGADQA